MMESDRVISIHSYLLELGISSKLDATIILGSGLGDFGRHIQNSTVIPYVEIPDFPQSTVTGHSGYLIIGDILGKKVMAFSGRFHFYEGYPFSTTIIPIQLSAIFGVNTMIISNAAGGINFNYHVGDLMIINNIIHPHIDIPISKKDNWKKQLYNNAKAAEIIAKQIGLEVKNGTYLYVTGPNYETKAEIRAFRELGGDAVGMSTAPEMIEAYKLEIQTVAISLITNAAAGVTHQKLDHAEVKEAAEMKKDEFAKLVIGLIKNL